MISVVMYTQAKRKNRSDPFGRRLAGDSGEGVVGPAGQAIRAVSLSVVVTALAQTVLAGLGLGGGRNPSRGS